jgi:hypothetical protein
MLLATPLARGAALRHLQGNIRDNVSTVYMSRNPVYHRRTKHIELDRHFVREKVAIGEVRVAHIPTTQQLADIFTKGLSTALYEEFRRSLCINYNTAATAGGGGGGG